MEREKLADPSLTVPTERPLGGGPGRKEGREEGVEGRMLPHLSNGACPATLPRPSRVPFSGGRREEGGKAAGFREVRV